MIIVITQKLTIHHLPKGTIFVEKKYEKHYILVYMSNYEKYYIILDRYMYDIFLFFIGGERGG